MSHRKPVVFVGVCVVVTLAACHSRPRQRPLQTTPITNTLEEARKALQGNWTLVSLNTTAADGRSAAIDATGTLTFQAFGDMFIEFRMSLRGQETLAALGIKSPNPVLSTSGSVAIDAPQQRITYVGEDFQKRALGFDPDLAARRANPFALERIRYYQIAEDGTLSLSTRYDDGKVASVSRWKRSS